MIKPNFFTKEDLLELSRFAGKKYELNNQLHLESVKRIKDGVWEKTRYWFDQVLVKLDGFEGSCKKNWSQRSRENGKTISSFKGYTWAKIAKIGDLDKDIYFTLGADSTKSGEETLVYKLDYQFQGQTRLTDKQKSLCEIMIKSSSAAWCEVTQGDFGNYSWEKLINETVDFIGKYKTLYDQAIQNVWSMKDRRIARLTFNTNGWVIPSGPLGKSLDNDSHESRYGYGHEEWLLDTSRLIDGYHYGFLEPVRKQMQSYAGKSYNVWLYTIDGTDKTRYWVGEIENLEAFDEEEANRILDIYKQRGWLEEMEKQIAASGANPSGWSNWKGVDLFNVRFKPINLKLNYPLIEFGADHPAYKISRYTFASADCLPIGVAEKNFGFVEPNDAEDHSSLNGGVRTSTYSRDQKQVEIRFLHDAISNGLRKFLREKLEFRNVTAEHSAFEGGRIDIVTKDSGKLTFFEIKTYNSLKYSIREAIGQLFEYSYWLENNFAEKLVVVTQPHNSAEVEKAAKYLAHLRKTFRIPIYLRTFDYEANKLSEEF